MAINLFESWNAKLKNIKFPKFNNVLTHIKNYRPGKLQTAIVSFGLLLGCAAVYNQFMASQREITDLARFTEYYDYTNEDNGGIELVQESYYTFEKKYNFSGDYMEIDPIKIGVSVESIAKENLGENTEKKTTPEKIQYVIKKGDTLDTIAKVFGTKKEVIVENNPFLKQRAAKRGDKIIVLSENGIMYKIAKGDSLSKIANKYKINVDDILAYNNGLNTRNLKVGQDIFIKDPNVKSFDSLTESKKKEIKDMKLPKGDKNILVTRDEKIKKGSKKSAKEVAKERVAQESAASSGGNGFRYPVSYAGVSSPFGNRFHPVLRRYVLHTGVDLVAKYVPLRASRSGRVSFAGYMGGYGKVIIVKHPDGYETRYAHLNSINVSVGSVVKAGQSIGKTGMSGRVTGPHLHFEIRKNGQARNPMRFLGRK